MPDPVVEVFQGPAATGDDQHAEQGYTEDRDWAVHALKGTKLLALGRLAYAGFSEKPARGMYIRLWRKMGA